MLSLATVPAALCLAVTSITFGPGTPVPTVPPAQQAAAGVSDPEPVDCPFCGGNPVVHVKVLWQMQKESARAFTARLL